MQARRALKSMFGVARIWTAPLGVEGAMQVSCAAIWKDYAQ